MRLTVPHDLIEAARHGGADEIESLLEAIWPSAYGIARAITMHRQAAQDAAQEASVAMYRGISSLRDADAFGAWFYRIVTREALRQKKSLYATEPLDESSSYSDDHVAVMDLWRALATISSAHRATVVLYYFEGLSTREIARALRVPDPTVRFRLMAARRRLRSLLQQIEPSASTKGDELYAF